MYRQYGKRLFDIVASGCALVLLAPFMFLTALAIRLEDGGPALYRQKRVGRGGRLFTLYKFRSMPVNTAMVPSAQGNTLVVTQTGSVIRRTNADELPQLLNILRGDMSIVGPRPPLASQRELLQLRAARGMRDCTPGLTGLAQVNSYENMPDEVKARWDAEYSQNVTFLGDMKIIARTFMYLLSPPPNY